MNSWLRLIHSAWWYQAITWTITDSTYFHKKCYFKLVFEDLGQWLNQYEITAKHGPQDGLRLAYQPQQLT